MQRNIKFDFIESNVPKISIETFFGLKWIVWEVIYLYENCFTFFADTGNWEILHNWLSELLYFMQQIHIHMSVLAEMKIWVGKWWYILGLWTHFLVAKYRSMFVGEESVASGYFGHKNTTVNENFLQFQR